MRRIAVDLTPIMPGGFNGGAKVMVIELIRELIHILPDVGFILLTSEKNHAELAALNAHNVKRICVLRSDDSAAYQFVKQRFAFIKRLLPVFLHYRAKYFCRKLLIKVRTPALLRANSVDLLYCPFTAPFYQEKSIPTVSTIYDLQYHFYPEFFSKDDCYHRATHFQQACQRADRLICISNYVRDSVLANTELSPEKVKTIHIFLANRLPVPSANQMTKTLADLKVNAQNFLLYPANFWKHKNHEMLFTAFSLYRSQRPQSTLKLVCTGAPDQRMEYLAQSVKRMGLSDRIILPGYLSDEELAVLMSNCLAVIFPSLYEGFGMPILEGMAWNKPVLCSNLTSLPEVAGPAAYLFDPRKPTEIAKAIQQLEEDPEFREQLVASGKKQLAHFGTVKDMAMRYVEVFQEVMHEREEGRLF